jgi:hypothetical protein
MVTGIILFILISNHLVNPLGLLTGLSVVVVSISDLPHCRRPPAPHAPGGS